MSAGALAGPGSSDFTVSDRTGTAASAAGPSALNVCMFTPSACGGHAKYTQALLSAVAEAGTRLGVFPSLVTSEDLATEFRGPGYPVHRVLPRLAHRDEFPGTAAWALSRASHYVRRERSFLDWLGGNPGVDIVHFQEYAAWLAPRHFRALRRRGLRVVYTVHNIHEHRHINRLDGALRPACWRSAWRSCNLLLVHSGGLRDDLSRFLGPGHPEIRVTPHAVWDVAPRDPGDAPQGRGGWRARLLFFGVVRKNKGLHVLLEALQRLPDVHLTAAGAFEDAGYLDRVRALCDELPPGQVELINRVVPEPEVACLFRGCDLVILPYTSFASQSGVLMQALAYGRPVVSTDVGALGECVRAWGVGEVVPPGDAEALAAGVVAALDPGRSRAAVEATGRVRCGLSWAGMAEQTIDAYRAVAS